MFLRMADFEEPVSERRPGEMFLLVDVTWMKKPSKCTFSSVTSMVTEKRMANWVKKERVS